MSSRKLKLLCCGSVEGKFHALHKKLTSLNSGKAGPFDLCLCSGPFFGSDQIEATSALLQRNNDDGGMEFPFPVYFVEEGELPKDVTLPYEETEYDNIVRIAPNVYRITTCHVSKEEGVCQLTDDDMADITALPEGDLVVAHVPRNARLEEGSGPSTRYHPLQVKAKHASYVGCDVLMTCEWGQGIVKLFKSSDQAKCSELHSNMNELGSYDVAEFSVLCKPRYHIASTSKEMQFLHFAALPYRNIPAAFCDTMSKTHLTRFISLGCVTETKPQKEKKYLHAVNILNITALDKETLAQGFNDALPCPYTDDSYGSTNDGVIFTNKAQTRGLSEASARSIIQEDKSSYSNNDFRWNLNKKSNRKRPLVDNPDSSSVTLHISGLFRAGSSSSIKGVDVLDALMNFCPQKVRLGNKDYGFIDFSSHEDARKCIENSKDISGKFAQVKVNGVILDLNWSTDAQNKQKRKRFTESEAMDSSSLYFRVIHRQEESRVTSEEFNELLEHVRVLSEKALEDEVQPEEGDRVTAEQEPALAVKSRHVSSKSDNSTAPLFGFLDFASHAAASMAVQLLTSSLDGGFLSTASLKTDEKTKRKLNSAVLNWAPKPKPKFEEARTDCWFCLASPTCEKHLIVSVRNSCYVAMPKGPLNEHHILVVPVEHDDEEHGIGAFTGSSSEEVVEIVKDCRNFTRSTLSKELFVFERAFQTKGGYHSHVQCIPVDSTAAKNLHSILIGSASKLQISFKEVTSDFGLRTVISALTDNEERKNIEYFYAEVPFGGSFKRYVYIRSDTDPFLPLQFGREVAANSMNMDVERSYWKECVLPHSDESRLVESYRSSFEKFCAGKHS